MHTSSLLTLTYKNLHTYYTAYSISSFSLLLVYRSYSFKDEIHLNAAQFLLRLYMCI